MPSNDGAGNGLLAAGSATARFELRAFGGETSTVLDTYTVPVTLLAAVNGSAQGRLVDAQGAVLPEVQVSIRKFSTGQEATAVTNDIGVFTFPSLPPGEWDFTVPNFTPTKWFYLPSGGSLDLGNIGS